MFVFSILVQFLLASDVLISVLISYFVFICM